MGDFARTLAFEVRLMRRLSTRVEARWWGEVHFDEGFPRRFDSNFVWVQAPVPQLEGADLADEAEVNLGDAGLQHRSIRIDHDVDGTRAALGLADLGYTGDRTVVMARRGPPPRLSSTPVEPLGFEHVRRSVETTIRREPLTTDEETVRMLTDYRGKLERVAGVRFFGAQMDGRVASYCELRLDEGIAQVEDVNTLEEFRGRGLAKAVIGAACDAACDAGAEIVFLHALAEDWPKALYAKLGFEPIGHVWSFTRWPERPSGPEADDVTKSTV